MKVLGIETSCDETAVSIIEAEGDFGADFRYTLLGDALLSQAQLHAEFGGVYPNLAKREHAKNLIPLLSSALHDADMLHKAESPVVSKDRMDAIKALLEREPELFAQLVIFLATYAPADIDAIAVTAGPGLEPALWVGVNLAKALALAWEKPIVAANHMEGHIVISSMTESAFGPLQFPALALLISGGHTELILMRDWMQYQKIGETRDDAVGEAFDKTARLLGLPYPGGPALSKLASEARAESIEDTYRFKRPMLDSNDFDFSFSGLKTALRVAVEGKELDDTEKKRLARAFEDTVTDVLVAKVRKALDAHGAHSLIVGGGVSANTYIRNALQTLIDDEFSETTLLLPAAQQATDNARMIALAGYFHALRGNFTAPDAIRAKGTGSF